MVTLPYNSTWHFGRFVQAVFVDTAELLSALMNSAPRHLGLSKAYACPYFKFQEIALVLELCPSVSYHGKTAAAAKFPSFTWEPKQVMG